ncbi:MAG: hypothetical protein VX804_01670 [Candidatus Thermoplasmatota archaeon]|nr:hypothetical protein [Candidatus Thermoplasmatota archaeon]
MDESDGQVIMTEPQWQRLWEKSAIGTKIDGGGLKFFPEEVIFTHIHRHQSLPYDNWITDNIKIYPDLEDKYFLLEALRVPGNLVQLYPENNASDGTWALRWHKEDHPDRDNPTSEIRWYRARDNIQINDLLSWTISVTNKERIPEVLVIDDECSIVSYELVIADPSGNVEYDSSIKMSEWKNLGINTRFRNRLSEVELSVIQQDDSTLHSIVLSDLISRGLAIRSGFKYGTLWRGYSTDIGDEHAPWLIDTVIEAPINWTQACLNARLAAGVNKQYIIGITDQDNRSDSIQYLEFRRPPSYRRWTNLTRH